MLMRRNVTAGIGSNEQGGIVERLCSDLIAKNCDINGLLYFTLQDVIALQLQQVLNEWLSVES